MIALVPTIKHIARRIVFGPPKPRRLMRDVYRAKKSETTAKLRREVTQKPLAEAVDRVRVEQSIYDAMAVALDIKVGAGE